MWISFRLYLFLKDIKCHESAVRGFIIIPVSFSPLNNDSYS